MDYLPRECQTIASVCIILACLKLIALIFSILSSFYCSFLIFLCNPFFFCIHAFKRVMIIIINSRCIDKSCCGGGSSIGSSIIVSKGCSCIEEGIRLFWLDFCCPWKCWKGIRINHISECKSTGRFVSRSFICNHNYFWNIRRSSAVGCFSLYQILTDIFVAFVAALGSVRWGASATSTIEN